MTNLITKLSTSAFALMLAFPVQAQDTLTADSVVATINGTEVTLGHMLMVRAALPTALFGLGGVLYRYRPEGDLRIIAMVCGISLILHPVIVYTLGNLTGLAKPAFRSMVLTSAMAPGINAYLFADMYGKARRVAASSVLLATASSVLTAWVWLAIIG